MPLLLLPLALHGSELQQNLQRAILKKLKICKLNMKRDAGVALVDLTINEVYFPQQSRLLSLTHSQLLQSKCLRDVSFNKKIGAFLQYTAT